MNSTKWTKEATDLAKYLTGFEVALLTSTDSLTRHLEEELKEQISAKLIESKKISPTSTTLKALNVSDRAFFTERKIWLCSPTKKLVYADSILVSTNKELIEELQLSTEPMSKTLLSKNIEFTKSEISISLTTKEDSKSLFDTDQPLFKKTYILDNTNKTSQTVKALITEIFGPTVIQYPKG